MNKFRIVSYYDDSTIFECISCKQRFSAGVDEELYSFCPRCGRKLDCLEKMNKRYNHLHLESICNNKERLGYELSSDTKICSIGYCYRKRLILEYRTFSRFKLSPLEFFAVPCNEYSNWQLLSHCDIGVNVYGNGKSSSVWMIDKFKEEMETRISYIHNESIHLRLILKYKDEIKIIKEGFK